MPKFQMVEIIRVRRVLTCEAPTEDDCGTSAYPWRHESEEDYGDPDEWEVEEISGDS